MTRPKKTLMDHPPLKPRRSITGMSAILLPFFDTQTAGSQEIDWESFRIHVQRTVDAGLVPAVNMDTGYANLIDDPLKIRVLEETRKIVGDGEYLAGAMVKDNVGDELDLGGYQTAIESIQNHAGTPIIFQSYGLAHHGDDSIVEGYRKIASECDRFYAFELGAMFAPFGAIYSLDVYKELLAIPQCVGAKHSSLKRAPEWERLKLRDQMRPDFMVLTGNDLAIDMVMYGSDYLLGLSTFAPDLFAKRDKFWESGDSSFYELNDVLQYLGCFAFREPTSAYKHSAAKFLFHRGWINSSLTHPDSPRRPDADDEVLLQIGAQLGVEMKRS